MRHRLARRGWLGRAGAWALASCVAWVASRGHADQAPPAPGAAPAPTPAASAAFAAWLPGLRVGTPLRIPGFVVLPLEREPVLPSEPLPPPSAPAERRVTLRGATMRVLDLPAPAGELYLRVENLEERALELVVGEAFLSAGGPSRVVTRPAWIAPRGTSLVSIAPQEPQPTGPYVARGLGLSPREAELLPTPRWPAALEQRNASFLVDAHRLRDASAVYATEAFDVRTTPQRAALAGFATPRRVGLALVDERGLCYARWADRPERFAEEWPRLALGLALDSAEALRTNRVARDGGDAALLASLHELVRALAPVDGGGPGGAGGGGGVASFTGTSFGGAAITWWPVVARRGRWEGLSVAGQALSLTWKLDPPPAPPPPQAQPPTQPPQRPAQAPLPTPSQVERDPRPSPLEDRLRERREGGGDGGARPPLR